MTNQMIIPKIILTNSFDLAQFFGNSRSYKEYVEEIQKQLQKNQSVNKPIFITSDNTNIINFEYNYFGNGAQQSGLRITLDFFDPTEEFEKRIISKTMKDRFNYLTFFIAFGASTDLTNWTNFLVADVAMSEIFQDYGKPRAVRLNLVSTVGIQELNSNVFQKYSRGVKELSDQLSIFTKEYVNSPYDINQAKAGQVLPLNTSSELKQIFNGYNYLDSAFKKLITKFLKSIFNETQNVLFLCEDIDKLLDKLTPDIELIYKEEISGRGRDTDFKKVYKPSVAISSYNEAIQREFNQDFKKRSSGSIKEFVNILKKQFNEVCPSIKVTLGAIPDSGSAFSSAYEESLRKKYSVLFSIDIPQRAGKETDDSFEDKVLDVLEDVQSIFNYKIDTDFDQGVLIRETDTRIIQLFIDYLNNNPGGADIVSEFSLTADRPLLLFGQKSVIDAVLYGREYASTKVKTINDLTQKYLINVLNSKVETVNYNLFGSKNNLLTPLQRALGFDPRTKEFIDNQKSVAKNLLVFRHNVEDPNITEISVNDYRAYHSYLGMPRIETQASPESQVLAKVYIRDNIGKIRKDAILEELQSEAYAPRGKEGSKYENLTWDDLEYPAKEAEAFVDYLFRSQQFLTGVGKQFGIDLQDALESMDLQKAEKIKDDYHSLLLQLNKAYSKGVDADSAIKLVGKGVTVSREDYFTELVSNLSTALYRVTIKTLPFFFVTGPTFLQEPCILLSRRVSLLGTKNSQLDSLISGAYIIVGITHRISKDQSESEFILQKIQNPV